MDFLATPFYWEIYEAPERCVQIRFVGQQWLPPGRQVAVAAGGAIALNLVGPDLQAKIYPDARTVYIDPPPGYHVNIRSGPGTRFPAVNTLSPGTPISITEFDENGWVQLTDRSWVAGNLVSSTPNTIRHTISQGQAFAAYIDPPPGYNVNIRSGPGVQFPAVNTLAPGTRITITGHYANGWAQLVDGSWVAGNLIRVGRPVMPPTPQPPVDSDILQLGSRSPQVIRLEFRLRELNYVTPDFVPDRYYGPDTAQAVSNFQRRNNLNVDGIAGPQTQIVLYSDAAIPNEQPSQSDDLSLGTRDPAVLTLEIRLQDLNYLSNSFVPDINYGPNTAEAVRNFQRRNNLSVTGVADVRTQNRLYSSAAIPNAVSPPDPNFPTDPEEPPDPPPPDPGGTRQAVVSTNDGLDALAFSGPGTEYDLLGFVANGTEVTVTGRTQDNWSELEDGSWIYTDFLEF